MKRIEEMEQKYTDEITKLESEQNLDDVDMDVDTDKFNFDYDLYN